MVMLWVRFADETGGLRKEVKFLTVPDKNKRIGKSSEKNLTLASRLYLYEQQVDLCSELCTLESDVLQKNLNFWSKKLSYGQIFHC